MMKNPHIRPEMVVAVMGLGLSGSSAVRYLHACGARVLVSESRPMEKFSAAERELVAECCRGCEDGGHSSSFLNEAELIFVSPGIPDNLAVLQEAEKMGISIVGELALAAPVLEKPVVAVTGTNGKTTVTTLIGELLQQSGKTVFVGGNIGKPLFDYLLSGQQEEIAVVEVSSFQLQRAGDFRPHVAVLLNITPDHLDRHGSFAEYIRAKSLVFARQRRGDYSIINDDDLICREQADHIIESQRLLFGHSRECQAYICESTIVVKCHGRVEEYSLVGTVFDDYIGKSNSAAAILAALTMGGERESISRGLRLFHPLAHRMQMVGEYEGVFYCNDSKATNTGAVISALQQTRGKVVLIAGGKGKGEDYRLLKSSVQAKVRKLVLIGEAAAEIAAQLKGAADIEHAASMEEAVTVASRAANPGDTVLLSPACASFDMFNSYGHRGNIFMEAVRRLIADGTCTAMEKKLQ